MMSEKLRAALFCAAVLTGCGSVDPIEVSGDPTALPAFKTFHVAQEQFSFATEISEEQRENISRQLRAAVVSALEGRGYREASNADVLVALGAVSRLAPVTASESSGGLHAVDTSVLDAGRAPSMPAAELPPAGVGREGDLYLDLVDPKTQRALWRASSSGSATTPSEAVRKARGTYSAMVARLPKAVP